MGQIEMRVSTAPSDVTAIHVTVTALDILSVISSDLVQSTTDGSWSGTILDVPPGTLRTVTAFGTDVDENLIYEGTTSNVTVFSGQLTPVTITLLPFPNGGGGTGINTPPHFAQLQHPDAMNSNSTTELAAMALDPDINTLLTYTWSSTPAGTFTNDGPDAGNVISNQLSGEFAVVQYTPQEDFTGFALIQVSVSDGPSSDTTSFSIAVGAGIDPNIGFDVLPDLQINNVESQVLMPTGSTAITYTISNPGTPGAADPMHLHTVWTDDCGGHFDMSTADVDVGTLVPVHRSVTYTASPEAPPDLALCHIRLTVTDSNNGSIWVGVNVWIEKPLMVFVSSLTVDGAAFAGQSANADSFCQDLADNGEVSPGPYKALLSFNGISAKDRIADGPYVEVNGTPIARNKAELFGTNTNALLPGQPDVTLLNGIELDENHELVGDRVWTGTEPDGTTAVDRCNNWTSNSSADFGLVGLTGNIDSSWTAFNLFTCDLPSRVYCFQQSQQLR